MKSVLRSVLSLFLLLASVSAVHAQAQPFASDELERGAREYEEFLKNQWDAKGADAKGWLARAGAAMKARDYIAATRAYASAAMLDKDNADVWLALSRAYLLIETTNANDKQRYLQSASSTAYLAYKRAKTPALKAASLASLADSLAARSQWRPALNAYKASLKLADSSVVRAAFDRVRAEHGFRMLDYSIDSDASAPRLCVQFSEPLSKAEPDFAKFVTVNGAAAAAVKAEGEQICVEDLLHGRRYEVRIRSGAPSVYADEPLEKPVDLTIYVRDRKPLVRFTGRNYVLPRSGQQGVPLVTVNAKEVKVEIFLVGDRRLAVELLEGQFGAQIDAYKAGELANSQGEKLWSGVMPVKSTLNEEVSTAFPVDELLPNLKPGLYVMTASVGEVTAEPWQEKATQWFVVSDLGLAAVTGRDGVHAFVRSLATAKPLKGVEVRLVARNNEVLATAETDDQGYVRFDPGLAKGTGGLAPSILVARLGDQDYGFLDLTKSAFDLSDRGVGGRQNPGALDAMLFSERGVYRPGETVHLTALLRDAAGRAAHGVPLTLVFTRPDGVEFRRETLADAGNGGRSLALAIPAAAMTGTWRAAAYSDPKTQPIGELAFLVEDYVPERLEMTLTPEAAAISPAKPLRIALSGRYLYGAPAAGLGLEGEIVVAPSEAGIAGFDGYAFGLEDEEAAPVREPLSGLPNTDAKGEAALAVALPALPETTRPLAARAVIRLREPSGRAIEKTVSLPVERAGPAIGVKPAFAGGHVDSGAPAQFDVVVVGPDGRPLPLKGLKWELFKVESRFQWYSRDGRWDYEAITYTRKAANGVIDARADGPARIEVSPEYGAYRLEVSLPGDAGVVTSVGFTAGWYVSETSDKPDILDIALDKEAYKPGDEAKVRILPRMAGEAVVAVVSDRILAMKTVQVSESGGETSFTVSEDWGAGAYVTAILYRPMDEKAKRMPGRAIGVQWLPVDAAAKTIAVAIDAPAQARPDGKLTLPVKLSGVAPGEKAQIVVAAVDVGILNLTGYKPPRPDEYYFGQRRLGAEIRDLYGRLIDGMQAARGAIRSGGDGMSLGGRRPTSEPVALFSGIVEVGPDSAATVTFDIPSFDGTLRIMAAAWSADKLGHAVKDVVIRNPVVVTATPPRFLTLSDKSEMHLSLHNVEGAAGDYRLVVASDKGVVAPGGFERVFGLKAGERVNFAVPLSGGDLGRATLTLTLAGPDGFSLKRSFKLDVGPAAPNVTRRSVQTLAGRTGALTLGPSLIGDFIPATVKVTLAAGRGAALDVPGILLALDRYPYGCAEQTVSRALPLLYLNEVAQAAGLAGEAGAADRVSKAIERVVALQDSTGAFGLWSPGDQDLWLTAYVTDFLARAKEKGYKVPALALESALDRLRNSVSATEEFETGGEELAYALYVLARSGRAVIGDLRYYADTKIDAFATPLAKAQIGAALALYGDMDRARLAFEAALAQMKAPEDAAYLAARTDFGTSLRDSAATLTLISESGAMQGAIPGLAERLRKARLVQPYATTQENAWLLLAARALIEDGKGLALSLNGERQTGPVQRVLKAGDLAAPLQIRNEGEDPVPAAVIVSGATAQPEPAAAEGFSIERQVFSPDGKPADLAKAKQNDRFVIVLKVTEAEAKLGHVIVEDRLPAGFEIENPRLLQAADLRAFSWLPAASSPAHSQFRDDRFVAAFNFTDANREEPFELTLAYVVRAVTPGDYMHPGAVVEDMYRPGRFARSAPGRAAIER